CDSITLPVAIFHAPGPQPVNGELPNCSMPIIRPAQRPSADAWASREPAEGLTIVSNRLCNESGSRNHISGDASTPSATQRQRCLLRSIIATAQTSRPRNDDRDPVSAMQSIDSPT